MTELSKSECERRVARLAQREAEVLRLMSFGLASKEIAGTLEISIHTVRVHRERIYSKLGVTGLGQAVRVAMTAERACGYGKSN